MKKLLKLATLAVLTLAVVACQKKPAEPAAPESKVEAPAESTADSAETSHVEKEEKEETSQPQEEEKKEEGLKEADLNSPIPAEHVRLTIYEKPNAKPIHVFDIPYKQDMNVLDLLDAVKDLEFNFNEEEGVVDEIAGIDNDNALGHTWMYLLNGEFADLGVISQTLKEGDEITWYFGTPDEIPQAHEHGAAPVVEEEEVVEEVVEDEEE